MFPYLEHNHQEDGLQNHRAPLYPSLSILITSLQSPNYNATLHREANPALCESDWKTGPALKSQHIIYPQNCFFKLVDQRASLQQHGRDRDKCQRRKYLQLSVPWWFLSWSHGLRPVSITVGTHWLWCMLTPIQFHQGTLCPLQNLNHKSPL